MQSEKRKFSPFLDLDPDTGFNKAECQIRNYRLYIKGVLRSESRSLRMSKLSLKVNGYTGEDWVVWYGTTQRPMTRLIACGSNNGSFSDALLKEPRLSFREQFICQSSVTRRLV